MGFTKSYSMTLQDRSCVDWILNTGCRRTGYSQFYRSLNQKMKPFFGWAPIAESRITSQERCHRLFVLSGHWEKESINQKSYRQDCIWRIRRTVCLSKLPPAAAGHFPNIFSTCSP